MILPLAAVAAAFVLGFHRVKHPPSTGRELNITLVQPSIPQTLIWDQKADMVRFENLIQLSEQALNQPTDLLIWPEAAVPSYVRWDTNIYPVVARLAREHHVWIILGSDDLEPLDHPVGGEEFNHYNASFLMDPHGELAAGYRKRNLVIFGEYVPFQRSLPFIKYLTPWMPGSFTPGDKAVPFEMDVAPERRSPGRRDDDGSGRAGLETSAPERRRAKTSVLICFEDNFPHLVRGYAGDDIDFLVNITNNGWFGESAAQWQHAANAVFRAVENGRPLVRCTNNGLTCWVDASGRIREIFRDENGSVYGRGFVNIKLPLPARDEPHAATFYNRHGDVFGWSCAGLTAVVVLLTAFRRQFP
jgi:apolipoprotein N-acyltransferase